MTDYNEIMESIEDDLLGKNITVRFSGNGREEFISKAGKLEDAFYEVREIKRAKYSVEDIQAGKNLPEDEVKYLDKEKRVPEDSNGLEYEVDVLHLEFEHAKTTIDGSGLGIVKDPVKPNQYFLSSGFNPPLLLNLRIEDIE